MKLKELLRDYQIEHCKRKGIGLRRVGIVETHVLAFFGEDADTTAVTRKTARHYEAHRVEQGASLPTVRRELGVVRAAFKHAVREESLESMPEFDMPEDSKPREQWLTQEQAEALLAQEMSPRARLYVLIAAGSGARYGAIVGLTVGRVSFADNTIDFRDPAMRTTKKRRAKIAIAGFLRPHLEAACRDKAPHELVLPAGIGVPYELKKLFKKLGFEGVAPTHIFKHSFTTWALRSGESIWKVSAATATSIPTLQKNYAHAIPQDSQSIVNTFQGA